MTDMNTFEFYWRCIEADMELSGTPLMPGHVVMSYCGRGASAAVTAGEMRRHLRQYQEARERVRELESACKGPSLHLPDFLEWIASRLIDVHGENKNVDYVLSLRDRAVRLRAALAKHGEDV